MRFIGSKSNTVGSHLIRSVTGSKSSHFLMVFDEKLVLHSKLISGVGLEWFDTWKKHNTIVWEYPLALPVTKEEEIYQSILFNYDDKDYDYMAFMYWPVAILKHRLLGRPMPKVNHWGSGRGVLCTGLYASLPSWLVGSLTERELEMTSPDKLGEIIKDRIPIIEGELCR